MEHICLPHRLRYVPSRSRDRSQMDIPVFLYLIPSPMNFAHLAGGLDYLLMRELVKVLVKILVRVLVVVLGGDSKFFLFLLIKEALDLINKA